MAKAPANVRHAIKLASAKSGVDFSFLVEQAAAESSFKSDAKSSSSSASGLYQFIDSTWLSMVDRYGDQYGLNTDGKSRSEILAMRNDPKASSFMAAAFASENAKTLDNLWAKGEKPIGGTELYLAHFLGAGSAASFLNSKDENPLQTAADLFPAAARANRNVFYDSQTGEPRTLAGVYDYFDKKFSSPSAIVQTQQPANKAPHYGAVAASDNVQSFGISPVRPDYALLMGLRRSNGGQGNKSGFGSSSDYGSLGIGLASRLYNPVEVMLMSQLDAPLPGSSGHNQSRLESRTSNHKAGSLLSRSGKFF